MNVLNEQFNSKLARINGVLRKLREAGVSALATDFDRDGGRLRLPSAPPVHLVEPRIHKIGGLNVAKLDGVTLVWGPSA